MSKSPLPSCFNDNGPPDPEDDYRSVWSHYTLAATGDLATKFLCEKHYGPALREAERGYTTASSRVLDLVSTNSEVSKVRLRDGLQQLLARTTETGLPTWQPLEDFLSRSDTSKEATDAAKAAWDDASKHAMLHRQLKAAELEGECYCD